MPTSQHSVNYGHPRHEIAPSQNVARVSQITPFDFHSFPVRVVDSVQGEPHFIAKDIAEAL
ncbi:hypothetical protein ACDH60_14380 [Pseudomonas ficuserectae]|uniref:Uncharacterized protein n=1 Tax=Pseudomonas amygdali pv. lachrymans TaxID=53707 RepID=A0ABR5KNM5_PSEAV|nr:hypothetical protein [Pseudomonas amygdali]ARA80844.1 hypothetical protein B5U27_12660 [Pseudomonas amygdali pv. lachrymans]KKY59712.1 hypothetical protein AAY85_01670 [Pseudomonas amygdali pv. lachrymans]KPB99205.1 Uncharacterized protein AC501_2932 [Pseudomonas amygdali pv. lachrymans]KPC16086.1 Uncharacterized protein AC499_5004 [Pseudomonas amygdali pv. lachrymans]QWA52596.1 hypothetical protein C4C37_13575 [Pseudomonas amygdali pv. lachrymans]